MTPARRSIAALLLALVLPACGQRAALEPVPPSTLPPAPYGSSAKPSAEELLQPSPIAVPERNIELRSESEEREDDPFDLPPE